MERFVSTEGRLTIPDVPGLASLNPAERPVVLVFTGTLGVRELNRLIEEATALRDELSEAIG